MKITVAITWQIQCAKSLTLKELLAYDKKDSLGDLMNLSLDYGAN